MARRKTPDDLSVEELRRLLIEKRRKERHDRIELFRRTGRVVAMPDLEPVAADPGASLPLAGPAGPERSPLRQWADRLLLMVEILAVLGLVGVLISGLGIVQDLNREVVAALAPDPPLPTPLVTAVVLPSGHTPPDAQGNTRPNDAEIPEHLRPLVQSLASVPIPTPGPDQAIRIRIPAIDVDAPVVQGDGWEQLKKGVGQHIGSANPGERGNVVLSAHNDVYGQIFRHLDRLVPGDEVILYTRHRQYVYLVTGSAIVEPTQVEVMAPTANPTLTLISCYPYMVNTHRIVVFARLKP